MIDLATRMVVGWQIADHLRTNLVTDALAMSITGGQAPTRGLPQRAWLPIHLGPLAPQDSW